MEIIGKNWVVLPNNLIEMANKYYSFVKSKRFNPKIIINFRTGITEPYICWVDVIHEDTSEVKYVLKFYERGQATSHQTTVDLGLGRSYQIGSNMITRITGTG